MFQKLVAAALAASVLLATTIGAAEESVYLYVKGQKSGQIKGSVTQKLHEDAILVTGMSHDVISPRDAQSGLPTGQRMHKPYVITKVLDRATPALYASLASNENLTEVRIKVYNQTGETQVYEVKLTNASIASISVRTVSGADGKETTYQDVAFVYQSIQWTWLPANATAQDSWSSRP